MKKLTKLPKAEQFAWQEPPTIDTPDVYVRRTSTSPRIDHGDSDGYGYTWGLHWNVVRLVAPAGKRGLSFHCEWLHPIDGWQRSRSTVTKYDLLPYREADRERWLNQRHEHEKWRLRDLNRRLQIEADSAYGDAVARRFESVMRMAEGAVSVKVAAEYRQTDKGDAEIVHVRLTKRQLRDVIRRVGYLHQAVRS